jgi:hypothetical protein
VTAPGVFFDKRSGKVFDLRQSYERSIYETITADELMRVEYGDGIVTLVNIPGNCNPVDFRRRWWRRRLPWFNRRDVLCVYSRMYLHGRDVAIRNSCPDPETGIVAVDSREYRAYLVYDVVLRAKSVAPLRFIKGKPGKFFNVGNGKVFSMLRAR